MIGLEIDLLEQAFWCEAGKCFDIADKVRLVVVIEVVGHIGEFFKWSGFHQSDGFIEALDPNIKLGRKANRLRKAFFKLPFGEA